MSWLALSTVQATQQHMSHSHTLCHTKTKNVYKSLCLYILKNRKKSVNVGQESQLIQPLMALLSLLVRGQSSL